MSQPTRTSTAELHTYYHQFIIEVWNSGGSIDPGVAASNGLVGATLGRAVVLVGISIGPVHLTVELCQESPEPVDFNNRDEIVDISMGSCEGHLVACGIMDNPPQGLPELPPADLCMYRLRIRARDRDNAIDVAVDEPVEDCKISIWPAPLAPEFVLKQTDNCGANTRTNWNA